MIFTENAFQRLHSFCMKNIKGKVNCEFFFFIQKMIHFKLKKNH